MSNSYPTHISLIVTLLCANLCATPPKLAIILVVDQFSYQQMRRLKPHFRHGFATLLRDGICYTNAHFPHANPGTAIGHTCLSTGTYAKDHGIICNHWYTPDGKDEVKCDDDSPNRAAVFHNNGAALREYGRSAANVLVDGLSDQFVIESSPLTPHDAVSLSYKSRAAITTAGKLGKAIWYDDEEDEFTSSRAYFQQLPDWLKTFNRSGTISRRKKSTWRTLHPVRSAVYGMHNPRTYHLIQPSCSPITGRGANKKARGCPGTKQPFLITPAANQLLLDLATTCVEEYLGAKRTGRLLLWVSLSCLDKLGHEFGPDSIETIDMLCHLDKQVGHFVEHVQARYGNETLFVLTADHGVTPVVELIGEKGYDTAGRIDPRKLIAHMNEVVQQRHGVANIVANFSRPSLYLNMTRFNALPARKQTAILADLKQMLAENPAIMRAWTYEELACGCPSNSDITNYFKQQFFPGRSGVIAVQPYPYSVLKRKANRGTHNTPYYQDTHVPLVIYQPTRLKHRILNDQVPMLQFAPTIAHLLNVQRPSACTAKLLPGFETEITQVPLTQRRPLGWHRGRGSYVQTPPDRSMHRGQAR